MKQILLLREKADNSVKLALNAVVLMEEIQLFLKMNRPSIPKSYTSGFDQSVFKLKTTDEVDAFNEALKDVNYFEDTQYYLAQVLGRPQKLFGTKLIYYLQDEVFQRKVLLNYSWREKSPGKFNFSVRKRYKTLEIQLRVSRNKF